MYENVPVKKKKQEHQQIDAIPVMKIDNVFNCHQKQNKKHEKNIKILPTTIVEKSIVANTANKMTVT